MDSKTLKAMTWQEFADLFEVGIDEADDSDGASVAMYYFDYTQGRDIEVHIPIYKNVRDLADRDVWEDQALFEELKELAIEAHEEWERSNQ